MGCGVTPGAGAGFGMGCGVTPGAGAGFGMGFCVEGAGTGAGAGALGESTLGNEPGLG